MKYTLLSLGLVAVFSLSACDDGKVFGDGLDEKILISEIELTNVENGKLTLAATVDYTDSLITYKYSRNNRVTLRLNGHHRMKK